MGKKFGYRKFYFSLFHLYLNPPAIKESFSWPFTVVYDCIGKDTWRGSLDVVKTNGTVVWCGSLSGPVPAIRPAWVKYLIMLPFTLFHNPKAKFLLAVGRYLFFLLTITISDTYYQSALRSFMHHQRPIYRVETD